MNYKAEERKLHLYTFNLVLGKTKPLKEKGLHSRQLEQYV